MTIYSTSRQPNHPGTQELYPGGGSGGSGPKKRRGPIRWFVGLRRWKKVVLILSMLLVGAVLLGAGGVWALVNRYESQVGHDNLLDTTANQPQIAQDWKSGPLNLLLLGSDSRVGETNKGVVAGQRSDTIMLVHISAKRDKAAIISIPRDSYVYVPAGGTWKGGMNKLNSAFDYGGAPLAAKAVSQLTGLTLDGAMIASFAGIRTMVEAVGGVNLCLPYTVKSTFSATVWTKGCHNFDGATAEEFMRNRKSVPGGDFGRMHDQQLVVQGVVSKVSSAGLLSKPLELDKLVRIAAQSLVIDKSINLRQLVLAVKDIRPANIKYGTVPFSNAGLKTPVGSAVELNPTTSKSLFAAIKDDTVDQWMLAHPAKTPSYQPN
jgi:LCP family protein required for cell wall assembly